MTVEELIAFEKDIEAIYKTGVIRGPIHLRDGNEQQLIDIFKNIHAGDFVFTTWANHLEALLHGIPPEKVKQEILAGRSMSMNFKEHNFYTSAIVGGICPIAVGTAMGIKMRGQRQHVWCFIGDMTFFTGIAQESILYAQNFNLPITFVVADNFKSVGTVTRDAWGKSCAEIFGEPRIRPNLQYYSYALTRPHSGIGQFISF